MYCPRLDHFVRFNADGTIGKCGHMINAPGFRSWNEMQSSKWLDSLRSDMNNGVWPSECRRCRDVEPGDSVRIMSLSRDKLLKHFDSDYVILGGVLDNVCNSACQSCNDTLSTKIGSLKSKKYIKIDNQHLFSQMPWEHVIEVDINGGEPTASPRYQKLLANLPPNVRILRVNTNGSRLLPNIEQILDKGIRLIVTLSIDGTGAVHDYVRWPVKWNNYQQVVDQYIDLRSRYNHLELQFWTTLHVLNALDFENIKSFAYTQNIGHSWAYLENPSALNLRYTNNMSLAAKYMDPTHIAVDKTNQEELDKFISYQDQLRGISIEDYL